MCEFYEWTQLPPSEVKVYDDVEPKIVEDIIKQAQRRTPPYIFEYEGYAILAAYKIPVLPYAFVKNQDMLLCEARNIGYPLVLKIVSGDIIHKTEVGGVALDITNDEELLMKYEEMNKRIRTLMPEAKIEGYLLQKMAQPGIETILGIKKDPQFGSIIMFGLGGIYVEVLKDVSFRICPIRALSARHMIEEIKGYKILQGFRGRRPADIQIIEESLIRLSQLTTDFPEFSEIDINPFLVYEENQGAYALDARFLL
ncbi:MAG: acetate--CoA ligase family protein [candidate division WOR-3 bacterium]|nr:acetate--CoA ligase family protein [candidate division WOR-3 bacterium]